MTEYISTAIVKSFVSDMTKKAPTIFKELEQEAKYFLKVGLFEYLDYQTNRYSKIKTLLHGVNQVDLYDIYFPLKIKCKNVSIETNSISKVFSSCPCITISGDAGSGKSTLVKHLFLNCIQEYYAIPIMIEFRYLDSTKGNIGEYVKTKIFNNKITESDRIYERMLKNGNFVFFLDGYDEVPSSFKKKVIDSLNSYIERYNSNKFLLTTRPYTNIEMLPQFKSYIVKPLSNSNGDREIDQFIIKQLSDNRELADKIVGSVKGKVSEYIHSFLANPLLLSLYILTFQNSSEIPNKKYIFYRRVLNALFLEHDSKSKVGYTRERRSDLGIDQFEKILKAFCFISFFEDKFSFAIDYVNDLLTKIKSKHKDLNFSNELFISDLKLALSLWIEDAGIISFAHRSLQEYFAARFIHDLEDDNKKKIYKKLYEEYQNSHMLNETEHFLSLLEEMDTFPFNKYYALPLFNEMKNLLDFSSNRALTDSYLKFLLKSITIKVTSPYRVIPDGSEKKYLNEKIFRSIYLHYEHTRKLHGYIFINKKFHEKLAKKILKPGAKKVNLNIQKLKSDNIFTRDQHIQTLALNFKEFVLKNIDSINNYINESQQRDREIIDLV